MVIKNDLLRYIDELSIMKNLLVNINDLLKIQNSGSIEHYVEFQNNVNFLSIKIDALSNEFKHKRDYNLEEYSNENLANLNADNISSFSNEKLMIEISELTEGFQELNKNINELDDLLKNVSKKNNFQISLLKDEIAKKDIHIKKLYNRLQSHDLGRVNFKINQIGVTSNLSLNQDLNLNQFNIQMKITPFEIHHSIAWVSLGESLSKAYILGLVFDKPFWGILVRNGENIEYSLTNQQLNLNEESIIEIIYDNGYWVFSIGDNVFSFFDDSIHIEKLFSFAVNNATLDFSLF